MFRTMTPYPKINQRFLMKKYVSVRLVLLGADRRRRASLHPPVLLAMADQS